MKPTNLNFRPISRNQFRPCAHPQSFAEKELLAWARAGDQAAFGELCKRSEPRLLRMARHIVRNEEDAQDAVQEALLNAFRNLSAFDERSSFFTWATRIAINSSLMQLRKRRQFFLKFTDYAPDDLAVKDPSPGPEALLAEKDEQKPCTKRFGPCRGNSESSSNLNSSRKGRSKKRPRSFRLLALPPKPDFSAPRKCSKAAFSGTSDAAPCLEQKSLQFHALKYGRRERMLADVLWRSHDAPVLQRLRDPRSSFA